MPRGTPGAQPAHRLECLARFALDKDVRLVGVRVGGLRRVRRARRR